MWKQAKKGGMTKNRKNIERKKENGAKKLPERRKFIYEYEDELDSA